MGKAYDVLNILHAVMDKIGKSVTIEPTEWTEALADAANPHCQIWTEHQPPAGWSDIAAGVVVSYYNSDPGADFPTKPIRRQVSGGYLLLNYNAEISQYSQDWEYQGRIPFGRYGDPQTVSDGYSAVFGGALSQDESKLAICCYNDMCIRVFDTVTKSVLWTFGDGSLGNVEDGRAARPRDCEWLPNGNLVVSCVDGTGHAQSNNYGSVFELAGADGSLVAVRLEYTTTNLGRMSRGGVYDPYGMCLIGDTLYVGSLGLDEIGAFDVTPGNFDFIRTYKKPRGLPADAVDPVCMCGGPDNTLIVYSNSTRIFAAINLATAKIAWTTGVSGFDAKSSPDNQPHELWQVTGCIWDADNNRLLAADYGNRRVMSLYKSNNHTIQYNIAPPDGYELAVMPDGYDPATQRLTVPVNEVASLGYSCTDRGALVLGWKKKCNE